jgi:hypothetical protein
VKITINFETETDSYGQAMDRLDLFKKELTEQFQASHDELVTDVNGDYAAKWQCNRFDLEIEL